MQPRENTWSSPSDSLQSPISRALLGAGSKKRGIFGSLLNFGGAAPPNGAAAPAVAPIGGRLLDEDLFSVGSSASTTAAVSSAVSSSSTARTGAATGSILQRMALRQTFLSGGRATDACAGGAGAAAPGSARKPALASQADDSASIAAFEAAAGVLAPSELFSPDTAMGGACWFAPPAPAAPPNSSNKPLLSDGI